MSDADFGEPAGTASAAAYGAPARWATVLSPVAPESVVLVLSGQQGWQVKPMGSRFLLFGSGPLEAVVAEGEVSATETGSRVQMSLQRTERSSIPATAVGIMTLVTALAAALSWWLGHRLWWPIATVAGLGVVITVWQFSRLEQRVSDLQRAMLVAQVVKALRGREFVA